jgi:hypothetical protein
MKAFPTTMDNEGFQIDHQGMDLRDYFAAKAMQLFLNQGNFNNPKAAAKTAYEYADEMMKERK